MSSLIHFRLCLSLQFITVTCRVYWCRIITLFWFLLTISSRFINPSCHLQQVSRFHYCWILQWYWLEPLQVTSITYLYQSDQYRDLGTMVLWVVARPYTYTPTVYRETSHSQRKKRTIDRGKVLSNSGFPRNNCDISQRPGTVELTTLACCAIRCKIQPWPYLNDVISDTALTHRLTLYGQIFYLQVDSWRSRA